MEGLEAGFLSPTEDNRRLLGNSDQGSNDPDENNCPINSFPFTSEKIYMKRCFPHHLVISSCKNSICELINL